MSRASERTMARRRAHGPQQAQRKADALAESRAVAKKQRKGPKGVEAQMLKRGYRSVLVTETVRPAPGIEMVSTRHGWKRAPQEATA